MWLSNVAPDFRGLVERDDANLDDAEKHALNEKLENQMRELVKKYEAYQATVRMPRNNFMWQCNPDC